MVRTALRPARAIWHRALPFRRFVARMRGREARSSSEAVPFSPSVIPGTCEMQKSPPVPSGIDIGNDNERMIVINLWSYWAHLSIYRFALPFCVGRRILDVGCGVGYGPAFLAQQGATVLAYDIDAKAIDHARQRHAHDGLAYHVADLNQTLPLPARDFDVVFSSNVFEHVANVDQLAAECARVVKADGVVIVAVPPITTAAIAGDDTRNQWHVHHLPPAAWHAKLSRFFGWVECHGHQGIGKWGEYDTQVAEISRGTESVTIRDTDFEFPLVPIEELNTWQCITAVFVCREPRGTPMPETLAERMPASWCHGATVANLIREMRQTIADLERQRDALQGP